jgi:hypothetical protein
VGLERGPLSPVSTTEELLGRKSSGSGLEKLEYGRRDQSRFPRGTLHPHKLALTSPTSGGSLLGIVRSQTRATERVVALNTPPPRYCSEDANLYQVQLHFLQLDVFLPLTQFVNLEIFLFTQSLPSNFVCFSFFLLLLSSYVSSVLCCVYLCRLNSAPKQINNRIIIIIIIIILLLSLSFLVRNKKGIIIIS